MSSIFIQASKYVIMFLFLIYLFGAFYVFRYKNKSGAQKGIYILQKIILFSIHGLGFACLYLNSPSEKLIGFYLMQVGLMLALFLSFHIIFKKSNTLLLNNMCMLFAISFIELTRISFDKSFRQFIFLGVGVILMLLIPIFLQKGSVFRKYSVLYFVVGVLLLGLVILIGATDYGAKLVLSIGNISFQPSEFVKIIFVFFVASMLYRSFSKMRFLATCVLSAVFVLLLVVSKDLGGALLYYIAFLIMIYVATKRKIILFAGLGFMSLACVVGYYLFDHVRVRVYAWLDPLADIEKQGYQICQSLFGIGTGGWFGLGIGEGIPSKIPVVEKDFMISAISEEFGAVVAICVILLCFHCFILIMNVAMQMRDRFYKLVAVGLSVLYGMQVILTVGGAIKFIPSTGVTLPLVSYGGSSLLSTMIMFGIIQGLYMRKIHGGKQKVKKISTKTNKEFTLVLYMFLAVYIAMILYFIYFLGWKSKDFIHNDYNGLWTVFEDDVQRGDIITSDGYVIAETVINENQEEIRNYPFCGMFAHVTGYSQRGRTGLERQLNFSLLQSNASYWERIFAKDWDRKVEGNRGVTTIRYDVQSVAYEALGNYDGAVVVLEPSTGKILAMVSKPDYDPNRINADWNMIQDGTGLYNRVTQGQYTPGSVFKIFTSLAYIKSNSSTYEDYGFICEGIYTKEGKTVHCAGGVAHGFEDLQTSFVNSCNCSFANMVAEIDLDVYNQICDSLLFNQRLPIQWESSQSSFSLQEYDSNALKMDTAFGQGRTLVSPIHMAMIAGAVCNDGMVMYPTLVERIESYDGTFVEPTNIHAYKKILTDEEVDILSEFMRTPVTTGIYHELNTTEYTAYGKTGSAQTSDDLDLTNAWFVGYASKEGYEDIAIAVVVERSGSGTEYAIPIAKKIFQTYFE